MIAADSPPGLHKNLIWRLAHHSPWRRNDPVAPALSDPACPGTPDISVPLPRAGTPARRTGLGLRAGLLPAAPSTSCTAEITQGRKNN